MKLYYMSGGEIVNLEYLVKIGNAMIAGTRYFVSVYIHGFESMTYYFNTKEEAVMFRNNLIAASGGLS